MQYYLLSTIFYMLSGKIYLCALDVHITHFMTVYRIIMYTVAFNI